MSDHKSRLDVKILVVGEQDSYDSTPIRLVEGDSIDLKFDSPVVRATLRLLEPLKAGEAPRMRILVYHLDD